MMWAKQQMHVALYLVFSLRRMWLLWDLLVCLSVSVDSLSVQVSPLLLSAGTKAQLHLLLLFWQYKLQQNRLRQLRHIGAAALSSHNISVFVNQTSSSLLRAVASCSATMNANTSPRGREDSWQFGFICLCSENQKNTEDRKTRWTVKIKNIKTLVSVSRHWRRLMRNSLCSLRVCTLSQHALGGQVFDMSWWSQTGGFIKTLLFVLSDLLCSLQTWKLKCLFHTVRMSHDVWAAACSWV